jgi:hypothetical protein
MASIAVGRSSTLSVNARQALLDPRHGARQQADQRARCAADAQGPARPSLAAFTSACVAQQVVEHARPRLQRMARRGQTIPARVRSKASPNRASSAQSRGHRGWEMLSARAAPVIEPARQTS